MEILYTIIFVIFLIIGFYIHVIYRISDPKGYTAFRAIVGKDKGYQFKMGRCLLTGEEGWEQNGKEGLKFLKKVARAGTWDSEESRYLIGLAYLHGMGISVSYKQAEKWLYGLNYSDSKELYNIAYNCIEEDNLTAEELYNIGLYYANNIKSDKSKDLSNKWFRKAIRKGLAIDKINNIPELTLSNDSKASLEKYSKKVEHYQPNKPKTYKRRKRKDESYFSPFGLDDDD